MTVKHTPGPWVHTPFNLQFLSVHADSGNPHQTRGRICEIDGEHEATLIHPLRERSEVESNARLIAAAPDLLEACKCVLRLDYFNEHSALSKQVRDAITKAEGSATI